MIGKLEEGCSVTSVAEEFGIAHSVVSRAWRTFHSTGTAVRQLTGGRPRKTTARDDRFIVLQTKRDRYQSAENIVRQLREAPDVKCSGLLWSGVCIKVAYSPVVPRYAYH